MKFIVFDSGVWLILEYEIAKDHLAPIVAKFLLPPPFFFKFLFI